MYTIKYEINQLQNTEQQIKLKNKQGKETRINIE